MGLISVTSQLHVLLIGVSEERICGFSWDAGLPLGWFQLSLVRGSACGVAEWA